MTLTDTGRQFQLGVSQGFRRLREAVEQLQPANDKLVRIQSSPPIVTKWLAPRLQRFTERHPEIPLCIDTSFDLTSFGDDGPDVAIRFTREPGPEVHAIRLIDETVLPLASPSLIEQLDLREPKDMRRAPLLHDDSLSVFDGAPLWSDWFRQVGIDPAEAQRGSRFARYADQAIDAAAGGAGVVLGRRFIAMNEMKTGRLASPFGPELEIGISYFAICAKGRESETKISFVLEWLAEESEKL